MRSCESVVFCLEHQSIQEVDGLYYLMDLCHFALFTPHQDLSNIRPNLKAAKLAIRVHIYLNAVRKGNVPGAVYR